MSSAWKKSRLLLKSPGTWPKMLISLWTFPSFPPLNTSSPSHLLTHQPAWLSFFPFFPFLLALINTDRTGENLSNKWQLQTTRGIRIKWYPIIRLFVHSFIHSTNLTYQTLCHTLGIEFNTAPIFTKLESYWRRQIKKGNNNTQW